MDMFRFEWDPKKAKLNAKKHGVAFAEAQTVFYDEQAQVFDDPDHSDEEKRFVILGMSVRLRALIVCHCFRESESVIRLISARKADRSEEEEYWRYRK
jgi:uncharacterized protein